MHRRFALSGVGAVAAAAMSATAGAHKLTLKPVNRNQQVRAAAGVVVLACLATKLGCEVQNSDSVSWAVKNFIGG